MRLRAHHIMCLQLFRGKGYSPDFVRNMTLVKQLLDERGDSRLHLVFSADDLCGHCPHLGTSGLCDHEQKTAGIDRRVSEKLCIKEGIYRYDELRTKLIPFMTPDHLRSICGDCQWIQFCLSCVEG